MKRFLLTLVVLLTELCAAAQTSFWVYNNDGTQTEFQISKVDSIIFTEPTTPILPSEKCSASDYTQVTIGTQVWMAENYRCSKYDTQSEAYNASWLKDNTIPASGREVYTPYYTDASDRSKWYSSWYAGNLINVQVGKLGYLYNWAATVGVADGGKQTTAFNGNRQGICPNGWHVPSNAEWQTLYDYICKDKRLTSHSIGKYLKTTSGWYDEDSDYEPGFDTYGFAALPAGDADGSSVHGVGYNTSFWAATPHESMGSAYCRTLNYFVIDYDSDHYNNKDRGRSVRCLRDK